MLCPFSGDVLYNLPFYRYKALKSPTPFSKFLQRYKYGCQMLFAI